MQRRFPIVISFSNSQNFSKELFMNKMNTCILLFSAMLGAASFNTPAFTQQVSASAAQPTASVPTDGNYWDAKGKFTKAYDNQIAAFWTAATTSKYAKKGTGTNGHLLSEEGQFEPSETSGILNLFVSPDKLLMSSDALTDAALSTGNLYAQAYAALEAQRLDQQYGQSPVSSSSSNLVSKPGTTGLLSLATESGAFSQTVNGTSMTLTTSPYRIAELAMGSSGLDTLCVPNSKNPAQNCNSLSRISIATSFVVSQAGSTSSTSASTSGSANSATPAVTSVLLPSSSSKFSSVTAQYSFGAATLDPSGSTFQTAWKKAVNSKSTQLQAAQLAYAQALRPILTVLAQFSDPTLKTLRTKYKSLFIQDAEAEDSDKFTADFDEYLRLYLAVAESKNPIATANAFASAKVAYNNIISIAQDALNDAGGKSLVTVSYTYSKPQSQPDLHDFRLIYGQIFKGHGGQVTLNAAVDVYGGTMQPGAKYQRLKDFQFSGQWDIPLGNLKAPFGTWSNAGYAQYQYDPSVLNITSGNLAPGTNITLPSNAQVLLSTAGYLEVFQSMLTFKLSNSINLPVSIKWSNKTDLLNAQDVRGQIGISYDLSKLMSLLPGN
jgi:hypothetical protein